MANISNKIMLKRTHWQSSNETYERFCVRWQIQLDKIFCNLIYKQTKRIGDKVIKPAYKYIFPWRK